MSPRLAAEGGLGFSGEPLGLVFELGYALDLDAWKFAPECLCAVWLIHVVDGLRHEPVLEDVQQVIGRLLELVFLVVGFTQTAAAYAPDDPFWLSLCRFDFFVHGITGESELIECQHGHPVGGADVLGMAHVALDFRHDFVLAVIAAYFEVGMGYKLICEFDRRLPLLNGMIQMITIKGNTAINCGTFLKMGVPHTANVVIEDNRGFNISGELINLTVFVDPGKLNSFLAEVKPHMQDMKGEQLAAFQSIVDTLSSPAAPDKSGALAQLAEFGKSVGSGVLATVIATFLG